MKGSRLWLLVGIILLLIIIPFLLIGEQFEKLFDLEGARTWMASFGPWAWVGGIALLAADLVLPVPGTVVMSALGLLYGWFWGGVISSVGSILSGMVAYWLCRKFGHKMALWLAGQQGLEKGEKLFASGKGGWLVALSRWMPVLPEAVACLAGLARMPAKTFHLALTAGSLPLGFAFAAIGALGTDKPVLAVTFSAVLPVLLYALAAWWMKKHSH